MIYRAAKIKLQGGACRIGAQLEEGFRLALEAEELNEWTDPDGIAYEKRITWNKKKRADSRYCWITPESIRINGDLKEDKKLRVHFRNGTYIDVKNHKQNKTLAQKGTLNKIEIVKKLDIWWLVMVYAIPEPVVTRRGQNTAGIDLGQKHPAVIATEIGGRLYYKFLGDGKKDMRKRRAVQKLQLSNSPQTKKEKEKLSGYMQMRAGQVAAQAVEFCKAHDIGVLKMEDLRDIYGSWDHGRLFRKIKQAMSYHGIDVKMVDPRYTSQICPRCGARNKANDRDYTCSACGYRQHRDIVGALNISRG